MSIGIIGTLINAAAVLLGGGIGLLLKGRIPVHIAGSIFHAIGLCTCVIGVSIAIKGDLMLLVVSLTLGAFIGELLRFEDGLNNFGQWMQNQISRKDNTSKFAEGFVMASLLFCVGAMAIVGSIESGLRGDRSIILMKSILDGISAMIFASTFGAGVLFSAVIILVYQGSIEFFAGYLQNILTTALITQLSATGGVMILGIGLNMVLDAKIKVANLLPGLFVSVGYYYLFLA
ncbi:MAG: DUF554 domain-containing protein [Planctomycetaceae bacterium]|nr:DUF554 domain-containing protein [Planctomycetaceae bacterium]